MPTTRDAVVNACGAPEISRTLADIGRELRHTLVRADVGGADRFRQS